MATSLKNLSDFSHTQIPNGERYKIAIVWAEWNINITKALADGAFKTLIENGVKEENILMHRVPGSYELPSAAQFCLNSPFEIDAVICIGVVIRGDTAHFDYICQAVAQGIKDAALMCQKPAIFGVLTVDNEQQAIDRAGGIHGNKGDEAAVSALKMLELQHKLQ